MCIVSRRLSKIIKISTPYPNFIKDLRALSNINILASRHLSTYGVRAEYKVL